MTVQIKDELFARHINLVGNGNIIYQFQICTFFKLFDLHSLFGIGNQIRICLCSVAAVKGAIGNNRGKGREIIGGKGHIAGSSIIEIPVICGQAVDISDLRKCHFVMIEANNIQVLSNFHRHGKELAVGGVDLVAVLINQLNLGS